MVKMTPLRCPYCDAGLEVNSDRTVVTCEYCGSRLLVTGTGLGEREVPAPERRVPVPEPEVPEHIPEQESARRPALTDSPGRTVLVFGVCAIVLGGIFEWEFGSTVGVIAVLIAAGMLRKERDERNARNRLRGFEPGSEDVHVKDKWTAFFLCLFLGVLGVHKFYEGKIGMGLLYLFTFGLFGVGWFIDLVLILMKPPKYVV